MSVKKSLTGWNIQKQTKKHIKKHHFANSRVDNFFVC